MAAATFMAWDKRPLGYPAGTAPALALPGCADLQRAQFQRAEKGFVMHQDETYGGVNVKIQQSPGRARLARADTEPGYFRVNGK